MAKIDLGLGQASTRTSYSGGWEVTQESDLSGTPLREWVRAGGIDEHLVLIDYTQPGPDPKLYWYRSSHMGHVGALTDDGGAVTPQSLSFSGNAWMKCVRSGWGVGEALDWGVP